MTVIPEFLWWRQMMGFQGLPQQLSLSEASLSLTGPHFKFKNNIMCILTYLYINVQYI